MKIEKEKELVKFDLSEVKIVDLDGVVLNAPELHRPLGNLIYRTQGSLEWLDKCQKIYKGEAIDVSDLELEELKLSLNSSSCTFPLAVKQAIRQYADSLISK